MSSRLAAPGAWFRWHALPRHAHPLPFSLALSLASCSTCQSATPLSTSTYSLQGRHTYVRISRPEDVSFSYSSISCSGTSFATLHGRNLFHYGSSGFLYNRQGFCIVVHTWHLFNVPNAVG